MTIGETDPQLKEPAIGERRSLDEQGLNTGPSPSQLGNRSITPTELFFTRSHAAIHLSMPRTGAFASTVSWGGRSSFRLMI